MKTLIVATHNKDKLREIKEILKVLPIEIKSAIDYPDIPKIIEDGTTLEENAAKKVSIIADTTGMFAIADDTGLEVDILNGAPGVYSSRFAGPKCRYEDNNRKLLELMKNVPFEERTARFRSVIAIFIPGKKELSIVEGICEGIISNSMRGTNGFGYDPVFYIPQLDKTYAELTLDEKNKISHRGKALEKAKILLEKFIK